MLYTRLPKTKISRERAGTAKAEDLLVKQYDEVPWISHNIREISNKLSIHKKIIEKNRPI
jgi:hypothetical protein